MHSRILIAILFASLAAHGRAARIDTIASPAGAGAAEPFLSSSPNGVLLSWLEPVPNTDRAALRFARYKEGNWSAPRTIVERNDFFVNWADFPSIVEDARGILFAHWLQRSGNSTYAYDVRMATSGDSGQTWSEPFLLNRDGKRNEHGFVSLAPLVNGGVAAAWLDGRNMPEGKEEGEMTLRYATVDAHGRIRASSELDTRTCECCTTGMAVTGSGPVVVYRDRSGDEIRDVAFVRQTSKGWTRPALVHADGWKITGCPVNGPQVSASGRNVAVAWFTAAEDHQRVYASFSSDGGTTFAAPVVVDDGKPIGRVDVVLLHAETAVVSWIEQTPGGAEIRARVVPRNHSPAPSIKVADASAARAAGFPRMTSAGKDVFIAWTDQTAKDKRVRIARLSF